MTPISLTDYFIALGAAALPYLGAGVAGMAVIAGALLGIRKAWYIFRLSQGGDFGRAAYEARR